MKRLHSTGLRLSLTLALNGLLPIPSAAQSPIPRDLSQSTLEDLLNVQVTSVSKKEEKLSKTGAAVYVITQEDRQAIWVSASRAIRQPSRADYHLAVDVAAFPRDNGGLGVVEITGNPKRGAERLRDFEVGYRAQIRKQFSLDIATFASYYSGLQTEEPGDPFFTRDPAPPHLVIPRAEYHDAYGAFHALVGRNAFGKITWRF
jgi:hypothetical protein